MHGSLCHVLVKHVGSAFFVSDSFITIYLTNLTVSHCLWLNIGD